MKLNLADYSYEVTNAVIYAYVIAPSQSRPTASGFLQSGLFWHLKVEMDDEGIHFWHQDIQLPNLQRWKDIVGHKVTWDAPRNSVTGEMNGGWYGGHLICGHLDILEADLWFVEIEGCRIRIKWKGIANAAPLGCEPNPDERWPFKIDCWCAFDGVASFESDGCETIADYLDNKESPRQAAGYFNEGV